MKRINAILVLLLACLAASSAGQVPVPDTPAGRQFAAWLEVFNRGDRAAYQGFLDGNYPSPAQDAEHVMAFREMTGGFDLRKVEPSTPDTQIALLQERNSDQFARLTLAVEAAEPHKIHGIDLRAVPRPAEFPLPHLNASELIDTARKKLDQEAAAGRFAGAALIARDGKPVLATAYGLSDRERKKANELKTRFRIGSMNKMFTATAILQLVQAGKLDLNDPLGKYLSDYPNKDVATKVTIYHLLTHTGGTGDIFGPEFQAHRLELRTLDDYVKLYGSRPLPFEPGSKWEYSNYGFILLGAVIEKASGQSYYDYVRDHVFKPAGMTATGSEPEDQRVSYRSVGYTRMGGGAEHPNTETLPYRGTSAGGGYSTVEDLLKFANALERHELLDSLHTELLTAGKVDTPGGGGGGGGARYAFGFQDDTINGIRCFGHGGGAPGMNGELEICPGAGYVVAVLANMDPPAASRISQFITNRLPER
jgi:CubicO group peptidase (beta-lactamase class C family)